MHVSINELYYKSFLPFDIIYKIYFYIDDYCTANCFLYLCKTFRINFIKTNAYKHKFIILYESLFSFLILLPETYNTLSMTHPSAQQGDLAFFELLMCQSKNYKDKMMIAKDIRFIYNLYKSFFIYYFAKDNDINTITVANNLANVIILQGPEFLNNLVKLNFNGPKVLIQSKFKSCKDMFKYILKNYNRYNVKLIQYHIQYLNN